MPTIVEQLQLDAANPDVSAVTLLRRAKIAAAKLKLDKLEEWMESELKGYRGPLPDYRKSVGQLRGWNPYNGWIPINGNPEIMKILCDVQIRDSVGQIEEIIRRSDGGSATMPFSSDKVAAVNSMSKIDLPRYELIISITTLSKVVDEVKNALLDWSLNLERAGVLGSSFAFSQDEVTKAKMASSNIYNIGSIGSMIGNLGSNNVAGNISVEGVDFGAASKLVDEIKTHISELAQAGVKEDQLADAIRKAEDALKEPNSDHGFLRNCLIDLRNAVSGAVGNIAASGIVYEIGKLIGS